MPKPKELNKCILQGKLSDIIKKIMEDLRLTSFEDFQDKNFGKIGTPERDAFEKKVDDALQAYRMGEVIL